MPDPEALVISFLSSLDSQEKLRSFLSFMAGHPELSLDNSCLLYLQSPGAGRYVAPRDPARQRHVPAEHPVGLFGLTLQEKRIRHTDLVLCSIPDEGIPPEERPDVSLRAVFDRTHYSLIPDPDSSGLREDAAGRRILYPAAWNPEQESGVFLAVFLDYFWKAYRERGEFPLAVTERDWLLYRRALLFMALRFLGREDAVLPGIFLRFVSEKTPSALPPLTTGMTRMYTLQLLYTELNQAMEGLHFTLYETLLFNGRKAGIPMQKIRPGMAPVDVYLADASFGSRYAGNTILSDIPEGSVPLYPPCRFPTARFL